jgi:hypothetical protein
VSDKVKLPKEVGSLLEDLINQGDRTIYGVLSHMTMNCNQRTVEARKILEALEDPWSLIMQALVNGYEIEETPEDKVREYYEKLKKHSLNETKGETTYTERLVGVLKTLELLNIKISGVNA